MEIISGFTAAKARLARQVVLDFGKISPGSKETFGREMSPEEVVAKILSDVKTRGDTAVIDYTARFDRCRVSSLEVKAEQIKAAYNTIEPELLEAFKMASRRIRKFHQEQKELVWRGVVFTLSLLVLRKFYSERDSSTLAIWIGGITFGLLHANNLLYGVPFAFVAVQVLNAAVWGVVYSFARAKTESIYPSMLLHAAMNLIVVLG